MRHVFIIGSKGIPAKYGGFETFVEKLVEGSDTSEIQYHVSCMGNNNDEFYYKDSRCFNVETPDIGSAKAVVYDLKSLDKSISYIEKNKLENAIIYILACRIGPFLSFYKRKLSKLNVKIFINPDGHEWKRSKWNIIIKKYWKISERLTIKNADLVICDSKGIEEYILKEYNHYVPRTTFIPYGANLIDEKDNKKQDTVELNNWFKKHGIVQNNYLLIVGRFVPENNYQLMIEEFLKSNTEKDLVIVTNYTENKFYSELKQKTEFQNDKRVKFVGTVYDQTLLVKIRENAFSYIHGHEVGGTNPSLLESLATTKLNLLLNVNFNVEVADNTALYFNKNKGNLANLINTMEHYSSKQIEELGDSAKNRIKTNYSWEMVVNDYSSIFKN